jgi:hypothetical protein
MLDGSGFPVLLWIGQPLQPPMAVPAACYVITGINRMGRRFKITTGNLHYAYGFNVWKGSLWEIQEDGKRKRIHSWYN